MSQIISTIALVLLIVMWRDPNIYRSLFVFWATVAASFMVEQSPFQAVCAVILLGVVAATVFAWWSERKAGVEA